MTRVLDERHTYGEWSHEFDTRSIDPRKMRRMTRAIRFVFHDAFYILDQINLRVFEPGVFKLVALAAQDYPLYQRYTENMDRIAERAGLKTMPVWLAYAMASTYKQGDLPSPFAVLMHEPVYVPRVRREGNDPRVLALAEGEKEYLVAAPRVDSADPWEEDRTFIYLAS